jgi:hypothetical protein
MGLGLGLPTGFAVTITAKRLKLFCRFLCGQSQVIPTLPMFRVCVEPQSAKRQVFGPGEMINWIVIAENVLRRRSFLHTLCLPDRYANQATR